MSKKTVYIAEDGSEHDTERKCDRRNKLLQAAGRLDEVAVALDSLLKERARTADGKTLAELMEDDGKHLYHFSKFYAINAPFYGLPQVERVYVYPHNLDVDIENGHVTLREWRQHGNGKFDWQEWRIDELYSSETAAKKAAVEMAEKKLVGWAAEVEELRARYAD